MIRGRCFASSSKRLEKIYDRTESIDALLVDRFGKYD